MKLFSLITPFALAATVEEVATADKKIGRIQGHIESFINLEATQELAGEKATKLAEKNEKIWTYFAKFDLANCAGGAEGDEEADDFERNGGRFDFGNPCLLINEQLETAIWRTFKGQTCRGSWKNKTEDDEGNALEAGNGLRTSNGIQRKAAGLARVLRKIYSCDAPSAAPAE